MPPERRHNAAGYALRGAAASGPGPRGECRRRGRADATRKEPDRFVAGPAGGAGSGAGGAGRGIGGAAASGGGAAEGWLSAAAGAAASWQSAAAVAAAGAEGWQREGPHIGERLVRRMEEHGDIRALVRLYLPPGEGEEEPALWRVEHADGEISRDWPRSAESGREWPRLAEIARRRRQRGAGAARGCG